MKVVINPYLQKENVIIKKDITAYKWGSLMEAAEHVGGSNEKKENERKLISLRGRRLLSCPRLNNMATPETCSLYLSLSQAIFSCLVVENIETKRNSIGSPFILLIDKVIFPN